MAGSSVLLMMLLQSMLGASSAELVWLQCRTGVAPVQNWCGSRNICIKLSARSFHILKTQLYCTILWLSEAISQEFCRRGKLYLPSYFLLLLQATSPLYW